MLTTCWSAKGGSGATTVAVCLAVLARLSGAAPLLIDLAGDAAAVLGCADPSGPDLGDWLSSPSDVGPQALQRLLTPLDGIDLLACSDAPAHTTPHRVDALATWARTSGRPVFVDAGRGASPVAQALIDGADRSLLVTRQCYLAVRRAIASPRAATGVVVMHERHRTLTLRDIEVALDLPVVATLNITAEMAGVLDSGTVQHRMPTYVRRALRGVA